MRHLLLIMMLAVNFTACKDDDPKEEVTPPCIAGPGGNVTVIAYPKFNGNPVSGQAMYMDTAYVKFNSITFPGDNPASYNLLVAGKYNESYVKVDGLKCGNYYFYMAGWDTTINGRVAGGAPLSITQTEGIVTLMVNVYE